MKVIIKACEKKSYWYADKIGEIYIVKEYDIRSYKVIGENPLLIRKIDCKVLVSGDAAISYIHVDGLHDLIMN